MDTTMASDDLKVDANDSELNSAGLGSDETAESLERDIETRRATTTSGAEIDNRSNDTGTIVSDLGTHATDGLASESNRVHGNKERLVNGLLLTGANAKGQVRRDITSPSTITSGEVVGAVVGHGDIGLGVTALALEKGRGRDSHEEGNRGSKGQHNFRTGLK
jgi:hypothetical protein